MRYVDGSASRRGGLERAAAGLLLAGVTAFQVALAAGAPWGRLAWGGGHEGVLPTDLRAGCAGAAVVWGAVSVGVAARRARRTRGQTMLLRAVCGVSVVGAALNLASPSPPERALWAPVTAALAVLTWRVSRNPVSGASAGHVR